MANEISITSKLQASKGGVTVVNVTTTKTQTMSTTADDMSEGTQVIPTSQTALDVGAVDITNATGDEYMVQLYNADSTNFVTVSIKTGAATYATAGIMRPGEFWGPARLPKLDGSGYGGVYLLADTASCRVGKVVVEVGDPAA